MKWKSFTYQETEYDLTHIHPFEWSLTVPAANKRPERTYQLNVTFGLHTFTHGEQPDEDTEGLLYRDSRETRVFDFIRYELSKQLPEIVKSLGERRCFHTNHGNFFTIELVDQEGRPDEYEVYFKLSRSGERGKLNLFIQSAYIRSDGYQSSQPKKRKIGFQVIAYNVMQGKKIRPGK